VKSEQSEANARSLFLQVALFWIHVASDVVMRRFMRDHRDDERVFRRNNLK
jgi:hypothetical protein